MGTVLDTFLTQIKVISKIMARITATMYNHQFSYIHAAIGSLVIAIDVKIAVTASCANRIM